jgi:hypothetical protein
MADLFEEMRLRQRTSIEWPESEWAVEYEFSLLPPDIRFPRKGDIYVAKAAFPATLEILWRSPATTDVRYTLPPGCRIRVQSDTKDRTLSIHAVPVEYKAVERDAISRWTRWRPGYAGYILSISTLELHTGFTLETGVG